MKRAKFLFLTVGAFAAAYYCIKALDKLLTVESDKSNDFEDADSDSYDILKEKKTEDMPNINYTEILSALSETTCISFLTVNYLKNFRENTDNEIVIMEMTAILKATREQSDDRIQNEFIEKLEETCGNAIYIFAEYDPKAENIIRVESAEDASEAIKNGIERSKNGCLIVT